MAELNLVLDVFGQRLCTVFTLMSYCFAMPGNVKSDHIVAVLEQGLQNLATNFPWLAGQVVCEGACEGNTGVYKIIALEPTPRLTVKDLRNDNSMPSMSELRTLCFPMTKLDQALLAPRGTISGTPSDSICEVFQLQATFINGGVILTFLTQHQAIDGVAMDQVVRLFSKACRNDHFTQDELRIGNHAPENVVKVFGDDWKPGPELKYNIVKDDEPVQFALPEPGVWSLYRLTSAQLQKLKDDTAAPLPTSTARISTDDALTALIWQSVARLRRDRLGSTKELLLGRAKDLRQYLGIPLSHPGFVQSMTYHKFTAQQLIESPVGIVAGDLRAAIDPKKLEYYGRSFATFISRTPDKNITSYGAGFGPDDIQISSWAAQKSYSYDFGLGLGMPEAVRLPRFAFPPGLIYFMPKAPDGSIVVAVSLSEADTRRMKEDEILLKYASIIE